MARTYLFTFPFTGQVKTQLVISKNRLVKPKNVRRFEDAVRACLAEAFPFHLRPIQGYLRFVMIHYTCFKRHPVTQLIEPDRSYGDLDNLVKTLQDTFQPLYRNITLTDDHGNPLLTEKGNVRYQKVEVSPGVIRDDKWIKRAGLYWVPVHQKEDERIEVYVTPLTEEDLFVPPSIETDGIIHFRL